VRVDLRAGTDFAAWSATQWQHGLFVDATARTRSTILNQFDGITNIALVLLVITVLVGVMGLANTLAMDVLDRRREIGVLRALGTHRREVRSIVLSQALILTAVAGVLAVILGTVLGATQVAGSGHQALALPISFRFPYAAVPLILGAALVVGALAAITPARAASRMEPTEAVRFAPEA
jgi:putative ABC transport system permease protein